MRWSLWLPGPRFVTAARFGSCDWRARGVGCGMFAMLFGGLCVGGVMYSAERPPAKSAPFVYDAKAHRDPFSPLVREGKLATPPQGVPSATKPTLYGILWDPGGRALAMINDTEVGVGDTVGGYDVVEIRKDAVALSSGGELLVLQIEFDALPPKLSHGPKGGGKR